MVFRFLRILVSVSRDKECSSSYSPLVVSSGPHRKGPSIDGQNFGKATIDASYP